MAVVGSGNKASKKYFPTFRGRQDVETGRGRERERNEGGNKRRHFAILPPFLMDDSENGRVGRGAHDDLACSPPSVVVPRLRRAQKRPWEVHRPHSFSCARAAPPLPRRVAQYICQRVAQQYFAPKDALIHSLTHPMTESRHQGLGSSRSSLMGFCRHFIKG